jgi:putative Mg2+ transporter-C (MgtC) family protein
MPMTRGELLLGPGQVFLRLFVALLIGCVLGLNRELHGKPAGMRVHALVALGASLVSVVSIELVDPAHMDAVLRVVQGLIAGIGFLGGGVILRDDSTHSVHGLTTAASIWVVASLGIACGAGQWLTATMAVVLTLAVLIVGASVENVCIGWFTRRFKIPGLHPPPPMPSTQAMPTIPPDPSPASQRPPGLM